MNAGGSTKANASRPVHLLCMVRGAFFRFPATDVLVRRREMAKVLGMRCRECGEEVPISPVHVCELCFGPLEVVLNWEEIAPKVTRESIAAGPTSMWRYWDLLPG